jgi:hypothetical protein
MFRFMMRFMTFICHNTTINTEHVIGIDIFQKVNNTYIIKPIYLGNTNFINSKLLKVFPLFTDYSCK